MQASSKYDSIQVASLIIVAMGALSLALWILPEFEEGKTFQNTVMVLAHISFEAVRAIMVLGNIRVSKQSSKKEWFKPLIVGLGSVVMTTLIGISICSDYGVSFGEIFSSGNPAPFFHKQTGNIGILFMEITLAFILSGEKGYRKINKELDELELLVYNIAEHFKVDHSNIDEWAEVAKLVLTASKSEREEFRKIQEYSETFQKRSESFRVLSEKLQEDSNKFRKALEENVILFQSAKISIDGYAPIICPDCGTVNPTRNNRTHTVSCSGCGQDASKPDQNNSEATIKKLGNG